MQRSGGWWRKNRCLEYAAWLRDGIPEGPAWWVFNETSCSGWDDSHCGSGSQRSSGNCNQEEGEQRRNNLYCRSEDRGWNWVRTVPDRYGFHSKAAQMEGFNRGRWKSTADHGWWNHDGHERIPVERGMGQQPYKKNAEWCISGNCIFRSRERTDKIGDAGHTVQQWQQRGRE